jgi:hypothetical protein
MRIALALLLVLGFGPGAARAAAAGVDSDPVSLIKAIYQIYIADKDKTIQGCLTSTASASKR